MPRKIAKRETIGFAAERLMQRATGELCGAGHGERSETLAGTVEPHIPKLRRGCHFPAFLEPRPMAEVVSPV